MPKALNHILFGGRGGQTMLADAGLLVLRVWFGFAMLVGHGWGKLTNPSGFVSGVEQMGFPVPVVFAWAQILGETLAPALLMLGLLTRPAAAWMAIGMLVAIFVAHADDPWFDGQRTREMATLFAAATICLTLTGSGKTGLDRFLRR